MSDLPDGWEWATLGELCEILDHRRIPVSTSERNNRVGSVPYYGATGQVGWIDEPIFNEELVLLGEDGVYFFDASKNKSYLINGPSWVNNHAHVLRPTEAILARYLNHYLNFFDYSCFVSGTTRLKLTKSSMTSIPVKLPPLAEQRRILAALEEQLSRVDNTTAQLQQIARKTEIYASAYIYNRTHSADYPLNKLSEVANVKLGRQRSPKNHTGDSMTPYMRAANVTWSGLELNDVKHMNFTEDEKSTYTLEYGDLLLTEASGTASEVGKPAMWRNEIPGCCFQNTIIRVRAQLALPSFLFYYLKAAALNGEFVKYSRGVGIHHIGVANLRSWPVRLPGTEEQTAIVQEIENIDKSVSRTLRYIRAVQTRAEQLRSSLLREAFAGRLVPQDPDDEPASVLLERIRAERAQVSKTKRATRPKKTAKTTPKTASSPSPAQEAPSPNTSEFDSSKPLPETPGRGTQDTLELDL